MSFSISSSESDRGYVLGTLILTGLAVLFFFAIGVRMQPLEGDLTRIGSYAEKDFGWNGEQALFVRPLYTQGTYEHPHDVVVVGDSFSLSRPLAQWQNHLVASTGMSLVTLDVGKNPLRDVLAKQVFQQHPPRYLIVSFVERNFPNQMRGAADCLPELAATSVARPQLEKAGEVQKTAAGSASQLAKRPTDWPDLRDVKPSLGATHLYLGAMRSHWNIERTNALTVKLARPDLFTNALSDTTLIYKGDLQKIAQWDPVSQNDLRCRIDTLWRQIEGPGRTKLILLIAPDKLTAYSPWIADRRINGLSSLATIAESYPDLFPRLDDSLKRVIEAGVQDVYLPNDTHWGSSGHTTVAHTLAAFIRDYER
ncbi:hypothetical protein [Hydrogenophaga sp.]|uniref:hypothetical protein n=1 Tax=Hydrogenophaga sp. TaxID=1904254 RepID=UPI003F70FE99